MHAEASMRASSRLRVVEWAAGTAGAACGRLFAGFGHDVVTVEPPDGSRERASGPSGPDGIAVPFAVLNGGKRSVGLDPGTTEGATLLRDLFTRADVAIVGAPDADARAVHEAHPGLIVVATSTAGLDDASGLPEDSLLAESLGGLATMIGAPGRAPLALGGEQSAHCAGWVAFLGAALALRRRDATGEGELVDVALSDVASYMDWKSDVAYVTTGVPPRRGGGRSPWKLLPAKDGFFGFIYRPHQWDEVVALIGDPRLRDPELADEATRDAREAEWLPIVEAWGRAKQKHAIYAEAQALGLPFAYGADARDLADSEQLRHRGFVDPGEPGRIGPPWSCDGLAWRHGPAPALGAHTDEVRRELAASQPAVRPSGAESAPAVRDTAPLEGVVVLDLGTITAGAATTRLLADYGATVVKVEAESRPDPFRTWTPPGSAVTADLSRARLSSPMFESNNAGKRGIELDLKTDEGRTTFLELAARADVIVENFRVGVPARLGIDFARLRAVNPDIIYLSLSSQGQDGPEAGSSSFGSTLDMLAGLARATGYDAQTPIWSSSAVNYPDQLVSIAGAALVAYCLSANVRGVHLDVSQLEVVAWTLADEIAGEMLGAPMAEPMGNRRPGSTPHDVYACAGDERWVAIACHTDQQRTALAALIAADFGTRDVTWWHAQADEVDRAIAAWTSGRDRETCVAALAAAAVPACPVNDAADRAAATRFAQRRVVLPGPTDPSMPRKGFPMVMDRYVAPAPRPAPLMGEHTDDVLREFGVGPRSRSTSTITT